MKVFSSLQDAITNIRGCFCLGCRTFQTPMVEQHPNNGRTTVWILCGIPGTGKSTIAEILAQSYPPFSCVIISRDETRTGLLHDMEHLDEDTRKRRHNMLDELTTWEVISRLQRLITDTPKKERRAAIIIDGCHTDYMTVMHLLLCLNEMGNDVIVNFVVLGDADSVCCHAINDRKEGDYSDYGPKGFHQSLPDCVVKRKRQEMHDLIKNHSNDIVSLVDEVYCIPDCFDRFARQHRPLFDK